MRRKQGGKLENVLKGYARCGIENINIINVENMEVEFCGPLIDFKNPPDFMEEFQRKLMEAEVLKSTQNGIRLDCFI